VGQTSSYNESYIAKEKTKIALIPFGYFEGLDRRLSNQAYFEILGNEKNIFVKVAGNICMNLSCLDLKNNDVKEGVIVKIISRDQLAPNSLENVSCLGGGIYETLIRIQANIRRKVI
jgi:alanine racemase